MKSSRPAKGSAKGAERRAHPRASADLPITIGAADRRFAAKVRDISQSGVCFFAPKKLAEMTAVKLDLDLPGKPKITVHADGAVVRCLPKGKEFEVAIFFTGITESDRSAIGHFVQKKLA